MYLTFRSFCVRTSVVLTTDSVLIFFFFLFFFALNFDDKPVEAGRYSDLHVLFRLNTIEPPHSGVYRTP